MSICEFCETERDASRMHYYILLFMNCTLREKYTQPNGSRYVTFSMDKNSDIASFSSNANECKRRVHGDIWGRGRNMLFHRPRVKVSLVFLFVGFWKVLFGFQWLHSSHGQLVCKLEDAAGIHVPTLVVALVVRILLYSISGLNF